MVAAAVGIGLMCRSIAANNFYDIWNPSGGLFPLLALIFLCWSLACGEYRLAPATVLLASFELQCEAGFIPPTLAALAVGAAGLAGWLGRVSRAGRRPRGWPGLFPGAGPPPPCLAPGPVRPGGPPGHHRPGL